MKVSVLMPIYNDEKNLIDSIDSILHQSYKNFELVIINDASTDKSFKILEKYKNLDKRVKVFTNKKNIGLTKSLNIALAKSEGELIARQDSDDYSLVERLEKQVELLQNSRYSFCISRAINSTTQKPIPRFSYYFPTKLVMNYKNPFIHGTLMIRKNVLNKVGGYDENFYYSQDFKLFFDLIKRDYKFCYIKEPLYVLNPENNISTIKKKEQKYYFECVKENITPELII